MRKSLTRRTRLRGYTLLKSLFADARRTDCFGLKLLYKENNLGYNRAAFSTKKGFKNAVKRNRAKRLIREIYRKQNLRQGYDLIWIAFPQKDGNNFSFIERQKQLSGLTDKASLKRL